ncbi:MAG TPA: branched-chain amino acid ABC transporter permease [Acetobacteraceae bacterium]|nr:branched-chain amino acid ABC transporter permease [Acetobacteraceae bacterium]
MSLARRLGPALAVVAFLAVLPWLLPGVFYIAIARQILIFSLLALSLDVLLGHGGMISLAQASFLGVPAYVYAWLVGTAHLGALPAALGALAAGTVLAGVIGALSLRARGLGFLMITLAIGQVVWGLTYRWVGLTGGDNGMRIAARPRPFGLDLSGAIPFYYFVAIIFLAALFCFHRFAHSAFGATLRGTRDQPRRMRMLGHHVWRIRWLAFIYSGFWGSLAGILFALDFLFISPQTMTLQQAAEVLLMVILGGPGTLAGPVVGAVIITLVKTVVSTYVARWYSVLGLIFIGCELFLPEGLVPGCARLWRHLDRSRLARRRRTA